MTLFFQQSKKWGIIRGSNFKIQTGCILDIKTKSKGQKYHKNMLFDRFKTFLGVKSLVLYSKDGALFGVGYYSRMGYYSSKHGK